MTIAKVVEISADSPNGFDAAAGPCRPSIVNCIFSAADGDYGINEFSNTSFQFRYQLRSMAVQA